MTSALNIALIAFGCIFGGALLGMLLRAVLPGHHLRDDSRDVVKLGAGVIATLAALVLGILVGSAKSSFDAMNDGLKQNGAKIILLDHALAKYGPETKDIRATLRRNIVFAMEMMWPTTKAGATDVAGLERFGGIESVHDKISELSPQTEAQRSLRTEALQLSTEMVQSRWFMVEHAQNVLPMPLFIVLVFWLTTLLFCFGLLAPGNLTTIAILLICALSVSGAIFLILELNHPIEGLIKLSSAPLDKALTIIGK
jgi:membrane-bound ClpP family serine protease